MTEKSHRNFLWKKVTLQYPPGAPEIMVSFFFIIFFYPTIYFLFPLASLYPRLVNYTHCLNILTELKRVFTLTVSTFGDLVVSIIFLTLMPAQFFLRIQYVLPPNHKK